MQWFAHLFKNPSWDFVLLFMILVSGFFLGITSGKKRIAMVVLALYVMNVIFSYIPLDDFLKGRAPEEIWMFRIGPFLALLLVLTSFLWRSFKYALFKNDNYWWEIILMSLLASGFFVVSLLSLAPPEIVQNHIVVLSPLIQKLFLDPVFARWWIILPIFGVLFL